MRKVVIVTEDDRIFAYLSSIFQEVIQSRSALDAISAIKENDIDLVIVDRSVACFYYRAKTKYPRKENTK